MLELQLEYQKPYRFDDLRAFFGMRALQHAELVTDDAYMRTVRFIDEEGRPYLGWIRVSDDPEHSAARLEASDTLAPVVDQLTARVRHLFDLDSDPACISEGLASMGDAVPGMPVAGTRLPGCFDPFETACRAVLGQQVTLKAANVIAARLITAFGTPVDTGIEGLDRAWPTPEEVLAIPDLEAAFGELGVVKTRTHAIEEIAKHLVDGSLHLGLGVSFEEEMAELLSIKGIGPWTANYIAMRTMGYPDAFLESDSGVAHALPELSPKERLALAEGWRPWRSYAVVTLWNSLASE